MSLSERKGAIACFSFILFFCSYNMFTCTPCISQHMQCFASAEQEKQVSLYVSSFPGQPFFLYNLSAERLEGKELVKAVHEDLFKNQGKEYSPVKKLPVAL